MWCSTPPTISPAQRRRMSTVKDSISDIEDGCIPYMDPSTSIPRPKPNANLPPVSWCMVLANEAVTMGWRV